jgi:phosphonate transport system substrate-binding protein
MLRAAFLAAALTASVSAADAQTIRFAVTDIEGAETLQTEFGAFRDALAKITGMTVELFPVSSRTAAVEAMRAGQLEFVLTGPAEYVVIRELTDAKIVVGWQRPDYFANVVALADGPHNSVEKLKGRVVTFGAVGSTSQHLGPAQVLTDVGLKYGVDYTPQILARNVAVEAMIRGDVAAVGMSASHLASVRKAFPDKAFTVVARGRDLPNDILVADGDVPDPIVARVREAFLKHGTALMEAVLKGDDNQKFKGGVFLTSIKDSDYDYVRSMYRTIGIDRFSDFVGQ